MTTYLIGGKNLEEIKKVKLGVGTRIYYSGDMANSEGFGIITKKIAGGQYNPASIEIKMDDGRVKKVGEFLFSDKYSGNGSTRFVTEEAYNEYRQAIINRMQERVRKNK